MKKTFLAAFFLALVVSAPAVVITGFGTGDFVDQGSSGFSQTATTATFSGNDLSGTFLGTFAPVDITGSSSSLVLTATQTTAVSSGFTLQLYDGSNFQDYSGNWSSFTQNTPTAVTLSIGSITPGFNFSQVQGINILFGGTGNSLTVQFDSLSTSAIPEPSTYAALLGLASLGFGACRRRRAV